MKKDKAHSELSPSGSERWLNCPASVSLARELPPLPETEYSRAGTHAHTLHDLWLKHTQTKLGAFTFPPGFSDLDKAAVRFSIDIIKGVYKKSDGGALFTEQKVKLDHIHPELGGTLDAAVSEDFGTLAIFDYKHGSGHAVQVVKKKMGIAFYNTQLVIYALGLLRRLGKGFLSVSLNVNQPRISGERHKTVTLSLAKLLSHENHLRRAVDKVYSKSPPMVAGEWCYFCPARSPIPEAGYKGCPAQRDKRQETLINKFRQ